MAYLNQGFDSDDVSEMNREIRLPRVKQSNGEYRHSDNDILNYQLPDGGGAYLRTASEFYPPNILAGVAKQRNSSVPTVPVAGSALSTGSTLLENDVESQNQEEEFNEDYSLLSFFKKRKRKKDVIKDVEAVSKGQKKGTSILRKFILGILLLGYIAYFSYVLIVHSAIEDDDYWCRGDGLLIVLTACVGTGLVYFQILKPLLRRPVTRCCIPIQKVLSACFKNCFFKSIFVGALVAGVGVFIYFDTRGQTYRLTSLYGVAFFLVSGFIFSAAPRKVNWRHTLWGLALQFSLAMVVLRWPTGRLVFECTSNKVAMFLSFTNAGSTFVFGSLVSSLHIFAFTVLPVTLYFSFFTNIFYYFGAVQWLVIKLGWCLQVTAGTSLCESVNASANIFLGMTEAPLLIKPYLPKMTKSELHAVMTGGFATIAGSVMAAFISFGISPSHLLTACIMNAPAALGLSKLLYPETEKTRIDESTIKSIKSEEINALHAACVGVTNALPLLANIAGNLIAFIACLELINSLMDWTCQLGGVEEGVCSLESIFGYIFMPLAFLLGVQWSECYLVGQLIGLKITINEFVAYGRLAQFKKEARLSPRAEALSTFALCGFSNISSIGIMMGGLSALAPSRKSDMATVVVRAMITGCMATFMSTCIAGILLSESDVIPVLTNITSILAANLTESI